MEHKWYKGEVEQLGTLIYRDDTCDCGCVRRSVLNDSDKEEVESYSLDDDITINEPICTRKKRAKYRLFNTKEKPDIGKKASYNKLIGYIKSQIYHNTWIYDKGFYGPEDILMDAYIKIGTEDCDLDGFIKAINSVIYTEWGKFRKTDRRGYENYLFKRKMDERDNIRDLKESYLLLVEQKRIKYQTGNLVSFAELRKIPNLLEQVRKRVEKRRNK